MGFNERCKDDETVRRIWFEWKGENSTTTSNANVHEFGIAILTFCYGLGLGETKNLPTSYAEIRSYGFTHLLTDSAERKWHSEEEEDEKEEDWDPEEEDEKEEDWDPSAACPCHVCGERCLLGKDVATLINMETGKFACCSKNRNGVFHLAHVSCLLYWVLMCEAEIYNNQQGSGETQEVQGKITSSILCSSCQGTGATIDGNALEKTPIQLAEINKHRTKITEARRKWMQSPEVLENCTMGLCFSDEIKDEKVESLKLLHFYRVAPIAG